ncbi:MAG: hypothetical protein ABIR36_07250 [Nitrospiraceae bacterium]
MSLLVALVLFFSVVGSGAPAAEYPLQPGAPNAATRKPVLPVSPPSAPVPIPYPNLHSSQLPQDLAAISTMMADGKPTSAILEAWKRYVTRQMQLKSPINVQDTIQQVRR